MPNAYDDLGRPCFDLYYMRIAFEVAKRSFDPASKFGCVLVSKTNCILSTGYNSPPGGCNDKEIPTTRPEKYKYFEHAERNAIYAAARHGVSLDGATCYVTGYPCIECYRGLLQSGISKVIYYPKLSHMCKDKDYLDSYKLMYNGKMLIKKFQYIDQIIV